ncbi:MAG: hypothetical protein AAFZ87_03650 [Planctomycetota bacterium]
MNEPSYHPRATERKDPNPHFARTIVAPAIAARASAARSLRCPAGGPA